MHKLQRGYVPSFTYSSHFIADGRLRGIVAQFLTAERNRVQRDLQVRASKGLMAEGICGRGGNLNTAVSR
jgi:predicted N-acyltransferase